MRKIFDTTGMDASDDLLGVQFLAGQGKDQGVYETRWGIDVYHRTLESGYLMAERRLVHADRIESCLATDMVVA